MLAGGWPISDLCRSLEALLWTSPTLPLPPEARAILRDIADEIRKPPPGTSADPIALRRWLDRIGKRLDGLAAIKAGGTAAPTAVARNAANPRAALREQDRPVGIVVETRRRGGSR